MNEEEIDDIVFFILEHGYNANSHHKQWVLDQILRKLMKENYETIIKEWNSENSKYEQWDEGCE